MMIGLGLALTGTQRSGGGAPAGKTYEQFVAHIEGQAVPATLRTLAAEGAFVVPTNADGPASEGFGTSWGFAPGYAGLGDSQIYWPLLHGLPSRAAFDQQVSNGWKVLIRFRAVDGPGASVVGATRNGVSTASGVLQGPLLICPEILLWDGTRAQLMNPGAGTGPTPYDW